MSKYLDRSLSNSPDYHQQLALWVGNIEESVISEITIHETKAEFILSIRIPQLNLMDLSVQVTQEVILLQGQWQEALQVEGFFHPPGFANLIPLPHAVHPETVWVEKQANGLLIQLTKQAEIQPSVVQLYFPASSSTSHQCA